MGFSSVSAVKKLRSAHGGHPSVFVHFMLRFPTVNCEEPLDRYFISFVAHDLAQGTFSI